MPMPIELPQLPYTEDALEPIISRQTLRLHHGRHHKGYVDKLNLLLAESRGAPERLEDIVRWSFARRGVSRTAAALFNQAAQAWNHAFYWRSLRAPGGRGPEGALAERIRGDYGGYGSFAEAFTAAAAGHFGSGWAWLTCGYEGLRIVTTSNAETPIAGDQFPLLVLDVWEHAYYIDFQERRAAHVGAVVDALLDWEFAERNYAEAIRWIETEATLSSHLLPGLC